MTFPGLATCIARLEADIAKETTHIEAAIAARQIGEGYWQRRHALQSQLRAALALRDAINEALE